MDPPVTHAPQDYTPLRLRAIRTKMQSFQRCEALPLIRSPRSIGLAGLSVRAARAVAAAFRKVHPLQVAGVVLPAALFFGLAWIDYRVELDRTHNDVATTVNAMAEHAQTVVEAVDLVLARVLDHIEGQDWESIAASPETHDFLGRQQREIERPIHGVACKVERWT